MKELRLISFVLALFCLTTPMVTWAGSCPEGQKWNDRKGECVKGKKSSSKKTTKVDIKSFKITKPIGLFDANARRESLDGNPALASLCFDNAQLTTLPASPVDVVGHGLGSMFLTQFPFTDETSFIAEMLTGWFRTGNQKFLFNLRDWLIASSKVGSFGNLIPDPNKYKYSDPLFNLRYVLKPTFVAFDVLRQTKSLSAKEEKKILEWLEPIVKNSDMRGCEGTWTCIPDERYDHATLHDYTTLMLWGVVSGSDYYFQRGAKFYVDTLRSLMGKGVTEEYRKKKERGLRKQNELVGYLAMLAEIAAIQGYDLFNISVKGKSLWTAFEFLQDAVENPDIAGRYGYEVQEKAFLDSSYHWDRTVAWFEFLAARFPTHPLVIRFAGNIGAERPMGGEAYGGDLSCYLGAAWPESWSTTGPKSSAIKCKTSSGIVEVQTVGECKHHWLGKVMSD